ncbi:MAG: 1-deoxy-D-xylulose-5-phosphate reductoisomerase, partial [Victivallales bacterium]|nr:1-deoxy-D-xylulose-5-phosphate reductoisomerase [Victivallales bacterium]
MNENSPKKVVLLGSTGSIGRNAVIELLEHRSDFKVLGLVAHDNIEQLSQQAALLGAEYVVTTNEMRFKELKVIAPKNCIAASGMEAVLELVTRRDVDIVLCAILGNAAIRPALAALDAGKHLALASKEVLCAAGELVMAAAKRNPNSKIVPVDSEHSGLFQCLQGRDRRELAKLWFTASGGPFRNFSLEQLANVTLEQALKHPVWSMGAKITIDSASMMNKALEFIETHYLFDMPESCIDAVIHPQAKVHALVELVDG